MKKSLRIISWNCQGALRTKFKNLLQFSPDICIIQECENPEFVKNYDSVEGFSYFKWVGTNRNKGLGIFVLNAAKDISLKNWDNHGLDYFLPFRIGDISFIAVWACNNYIEDAYTYFSIYKAKLTEKFIICGDFNSSAIWDNQKRRQTRSQGTLVKLMERAGLQSLYHHSTGEAQGAETKPTFYLYRDKQKPFHIDHVFCDVGRVAEFQVGAYEDWIGFSDHMPIIFDYSVE